VLLAPGGCQLVAEHSIPESSNQPCGRNPALINKQGGENVMKASSNFLGEGLTLPRNWETLSPDGKILNPIELYQWLKAQSVTSVMGILGKIPGW
jgi:hypothetical protein